MATNNNSNDEIPYSSLKELLEDYGYKEEELELAREQLDFVRLVLSLQDELENDFFEPTETGRVYAIQASWGMGKTSFINVLRNQISKSPKIHPQYLCYYYYDSLYYGDVSEAIKTILNQLFNKIEDQYAIRLRGVQNIAKNLTPAVEVNAFFAKVHFRQMAKDTNSIISDRIRNELKSIKGKIFVVIDDIDRLTGTEALHLLRMVRLLRGLPNTYVFLPIDYDALIKMLSAERIVNPGGYVRKILTESIRLSLSLNDPRMFFKKSCIALFGCEDNTTTNENINDLWMGYLWELTRTYMARLEKRDPPIRLQMNTPAADAAWEKAEDLSSTNGNNFILEFFEKTRRQYNDDATDYLVRFSVNSLDNSEPVLFRFFRYSYIAPETTFARFISGNYNEKYMITQVGGGLTMDCGRDIFTLEVFSETDVLSITGKTKNNGVGEFYEADKAMADKLDEKKITFWELLLKTIPDESMPEVIRRDVSPRMIKRLMGELSRSTSYKEIAKKIELPRSDKENLYGTSRNTIKQFVDEHSTE